MVTENGGRVQGKGHVSHSGLMMSGGGVGQVERLRSFKAYESFGMFES